MVAPSLAECEGQDGIQERRVVQARSLLTRPRTDRHRQSGPLPCGWLVGRRIVVFRPFLDAGPTSQRRAAMVQSVVKRRAVCPGTVPPPASQWMQPAVARRAAAQRYFERRRPRWP